MIQENLNVVNALNHVKNVLILIKIVHPVILMIHNELMIQLIVINAHAL